MPEPKQLASEARATLAKALRALQANPDVPEPLLEIAEPIAQTMGILHRIEKAEGRDLEGIDEGLGNVRSALEALQTAAQEHDAADDAMEHVAASLSRLFALSKAQAQPAGEATASPATDQGAAQAQAVARPQASAGGRAAAEGARAQAETAARSPEAQSPEAQFTPRGTMRIEDRALAKQVREGALAVPPRQAPGPEQAAPPDKAPMQGPVAMQGQAPAQGQASHGQAAPPTGQAPVQGQAPLQGEQAHAQAQVHIRGQAGFGAQPGSENQRVPGMTDAPVPSSGAQQVEVELGAHSSSNFYKGLSGNDVIDHGGIFVQTYKVPPLGAAVALRVLLPGDLEFDADAIVQWVRETRTGDSDPGFGARFTRISDDGRQLVYRYVKNREPMFYDDL